MGGEGWAKGDSGVGCRCEWEISSRRRNYSVENFCFSMVGRAVALTVNPASLGEENIPCKSVRRGSPQQEGLPQNWPSTGPSSVYSLSLAGLVPLQGSTKTCLSLPDIRSYPQDFSVLPGQISHSDYRRNGKR